MLIENAEIYKKMHYAILNYHMGNCHIQKICLLFWLHILENNQKTIHAGYKLLQVDYILILEDFVGI